MSFTRPADTNAYTANDVIGPTTSSSGAVHTISLVDLDSNSFRGGDFIITSARFEQDVSSIASGETSFRLYLYNASPGSALGDNGAWDLPSGDRASFKGYVDLGSPVDLGSTLYVEANGINKQILIPAGGVLYAYLVTNGGYTPSSGATYKFSLHGIAA